MQIKGLSVASKVVAVVPIALSRVSGYFAGAADQYLQIHDAKALPANDAVPLYSKPLLAAHAYDETFAVPLKLTSGCVVAVSSTKDTLTLVDDAAKRVDVFAEFDSPCNLAETASYVAPAAATIPAEATNLECVLYNHASVAKKVLSVYATANAEPAEMWMAISTYTGNDVYHFVRGLKVTATASNLAFDLGAMPTGLNITAQFFSDAACLTPITDDSNAPTISAVLA